MTRWRGTPLWALLPTATSNDSSLAHATSLQLFAAAATRDVHVMPSGDVITCSINVESREYGGRYYTNVKAWKIDVEETASDEPIKTEYAKKIESIKARIPDADDNDLPF
jgi:hypothetical protein